MSERRLFPCCECCPEDTIFHEDNPPDSHEIECPTCERARLRAEALPELAEARAEVERLLGVLAERPERTTVWQDASDEGYRLQVAHAESRSAAALRRAEAAEAELADLRAAVERLADEWADRKRSDRMSGSALIGLTLAAAADDLRALLATHPEEG